MEWGLCTVMQSTSFSLLYLALLGILSFIPFEVFASKPVYLFAHGLAATKKQVDILYNRFREESTDALIYNKHWLIDNERFAVHAFNFDDALNDNGGMNFKRHKVNLGQSADLAAFDAAYKDIPHDQDVVLFGLSRGAETILNYGPHLGSNVKAIILESPFDTLLSIVKSIARRMYLPYNRHTRPFFLSAMKYWFPALDMKGIVPIKSVEFFPLDIPILFVHSAQDSVVSINSSRRLYGALRSRGHNNVYLLELPEGSHGKIIRGACAQTYCSVVHAFFKKYNLPHDEQRAVDGDSFFIEQIAVPA
jgi:pimeloyl-ACP methyl ester carboxylesterase